MFFCIKLYCLRFLCMKYFCIELHCFRIHYMMYFCIQSYCLRILYPLYQLCMSITALMVLKYRRLARQPRKYRWIVTTARSCRISFCLRCLARYILTIAYKKNLAWIQHMNFIYNKSFKYLAHFLSLRIVIFKICNRLLLSLSKWCIIL